MRYTPDLLQKKPFVFPEAPRWFRDAFYFCDIDAGTLYRIGADGTAQAIYVHGSPVSGWVRLDDGSLLVVAGLERRIVSVRDGVATTFADATGLVGWALNDLLRAPDGHCYVGAVDFNLFADPSKVGQPSPLVHVTPDGRATVATREIVFPNGMTILPSGELLVADSLTGELLAFTRQADGALTDRRVWAACPARCPTASASMPKARSGSPAITRYCVCVKAARSLTWSTWAPRARPLACSVAPMAGRC